MDGPGFYRCLFPMRELRAKGWDATVPPHRIVEHPEMGQYATSTTIWDLEGVEADTWVLQRGHCRGFKSSSKTVIADNDDNSLHIPPWHRSLQPQFRNTTRLLNRQMHDGFRNVDALTVSTPQLAEDYSEYNDRIFIIRNYLDWEMWENVTPQYEVERERIRVGWMGAYDFRVGDLRVLSGVVGPWLERNPHVDFVVAGANAERTHEILGVPVGQRISIPGVEFRSGRLPEITAVMDIGLVPLEPGRFNEGKSHLKGMEYAACGIPCIATPTESYRYWIEEGVNGLYAKKPRDWRIALEAFVGDDAFRRDCGRKAREKASHQTMDKHIQEWEAVYMAVGTGRVHDDELRGTPVSC